MCEYCESYFSCDFRCPNYQKEEEYDEFEGE